MQNFTYLDSIYNTTYPVIQCGIVKATTTSGGVYQVVFPLAFAPASIIKTIFVTSNACENTGTNMVTTTNFNITNTGFTLVSHYKDGRNGTSGGGPNIYYDMNWIAVYTIETFDNAPNTLGSISL